MRTEQEASVRYEAKFARFLKGIQQQARCLIGPGHQGQMARGHLVSKSRLRLLAESRGSQKQAVVTFDLGIDTLQGRAAGKLPEVRTQPQPKLVSIGDDSLTRPFACAEHDSLLFAPIDGPEFEPQSPQHCALVSYRTLLWLHFEALWFARALSRIQSTPEFRALPLSAKAWERGRRERMQVEASSLRRAAAPLYREAVARGRPEFAHQALRLPGQPEVAFAGSCVRGGPARWTVRERQAAPVITRGVREAVPFTLTCYPDRSGHIAVASCPRDLASLIPVVFPAFGASDSDRDALLSASALDTADQVMIAPSIWDGYGEERQRSIWDRYTQMPEGPRDALVEHDIAPLNLFA